MVENNTEMWLEMSSFKNEKGNIPICITKNVDEGSVESHRLYLARKTILEMLLDRGFAVPDSELSRSLTSFRSHFGDKPDPLSLRIRTSLRSNPSSQIMVIFGGSEEIKKGNILTILSQIIDKDRLHRVILVLQNKMNHHARKIIEEYSIKVEVFKITDLLINVSKHILSPKYEILSQSEKQSLLQKYAMNDPEMPRMMEKDAIAQYYGLKKGQVAKLSYSSGLATSFVTYRCVM